MVKLIFIRHGTSINNKKKEFTGHLDVSLSEKGFKEAQKASDFVLENYKVDAIFSSDLIRAVQTVTPIAKATGLTVTTNPAFREICVGDWQGMKIDEVNEKFKAERELLFNNIAAFRYPNGETFKELYERVSRAIEEIAISCDGKTVVIGSHGGAVRTAAAYLSGLPFDGYRAIEPIKNASVTVADYENGKAEFEYIGYDGFL